MAKLPNNTPGIHGFITIERNWKDDVWTLQQWSSDTDQMYGRAITITTSELRAAFEYATNKDNEPFDVMATIDPEVED